MEQNADTAGGPGALSTRAEFAAGLDDLRQRAGIPVRSLAQAVDTPASTIGGWLSGRHLPNLRQLPILLGVLRQLGVHDEAAAQRWVEALRRLRQEPATVGTGFDSGAGAVTPYRGLEPFSDEDGVWFFGREDLLERLIERVNALTPASSVPAVLALVGGSGTGKSSLLRAGLLPAIAAGRVAGISDALYLTPGADGMSTLARLRAAGPGTLVIVDQLEEAFTLVASEHRSGLIEGVLGRARRHPVVVALRSDYYAPLAALEGFAPVLSEAQLVVPALGPEQVGSVIVEPARRAGVEVEAVLVERLLRDFAPGGSGPGGSAAAVAEGAVAEGAVAEGAVADGAAPLAEAVSVRSPLGPGRANLPLLSHALLETWQRRRRGPMRLQDYLDAGGLEGAVEQSAEAAFGALQPAEQDVARRLFLRLVNLDPNGVPTRRRVARDELTASSDPDEQADLDLVVDHFMARRLVASDGDTIELSHEALIAAWPRLHQWIEADREGLLLLAGMRAGRAAWGGQEGEEPPPVTGVRLEALLAWAGTERGRTALSRAESAFLERSRRHRDTVRAAARRRQRVLAGLAAVAVTMALVASVLAGYALRQRDRAVDAERAATSRRLALESQRAAARDPGVAAQVAVLAYQLSPTDDAFSALLDASAGPVPQRFLGDPGSVALALAADAGLVASSNTKTGTITLYRTDPQGVRRHLTVPAADGPVEYFALALSPDGNFLAAGGVNGAVTLWAREGASYRLLEPSLGAFGASVQAMAISADGKELAAVGADGGVQRWQLEPGQGPRSLPTLAWPDPAADPAAPPASPAPVVLKAVTYSADGGQLAVGGGDGRVAVWALDATHHASVGPVVVPAPTELEQVHALAFDPENTQLAVAYRSGVVRVATRQANGALGPAAEVGIKMESWANTLAFSPDGSALAVGGSDSELGVWAVPEPVRANLSGAGPADANPDGALWFQQRRFHHASPVTGVVFGPSGDAVFSASNDGVVRVWPLGSGPLVGPRAKVFAISHDRSGRRMAVFPGSSDGTAELWTKSVGGSFEPANLAIAPAAGVTLSGAGAINPAGTVLAAGAVDGRLQFWTIDEPDTPDEPDAPVDRDGVDGAGDRPAPAPLSFTALEPVEANTALVEAVAAGPGNLFASASDDGTVALITLDDPARPRRHGVLKGHNGLVLGVTINDQGTLLAAASADNKVYLWNIADLAAPVLLAELDGFDNYAYSVAFSDDGQLLATGSADATVQVWDLTDPARPRRQGTSIIGPRNYVYFLAFQPGTRLLAGGVTDGTVWLWDLDRPAAPRHVATLNAAEQPIFVVSFQPDAPVLWASGGDQLLYHWELDPAAAAEALCAATGDRLTEREWHGFLPEERYHPPCS